MEELECIARVVWVVGTYFVVTLFDFTFGFTLGIGTIKRVLALVLVLVLV